MNISRPSTLKKPTHDSLTIELILKGGGCENVGAQYSLPDNSLKAGRDLEGVRKAVLDAAWQAQGEGCAPGFLGVSIGGDRGTSYVASKEALLRKVDDTNPDAELAALEEQITAGRQPARHWADGFWRQNHRAGHQDRLHLPPAGVLLRHRVLHVLGIPPAQDDRDRRPGGLRVTGDIPWR